MQERLEPGESIARQLRRVARRCLERLEDALVDEERELVDRMYVARVAGVDALGCIWLAHFPSGSDFKEERDAVRALLEEFPRAVSPDRMAATVELLRPALSEALSDGKVTSIRQAIYQKPVSLQVESEGAESVVGDLIEEARSLQARVGDWQIKAGGFKKALYHGFRLTYRQARKRLEGVFESDDGAAVRREFRRFTSFHRGQVELVAGAWPELLDPRARAVEQVERCMEAVDTLPAIGRTIRQNPDWFGARDDRRVIREFLEERGERLVERRAERIARRVYAEPAVNVAKRMESYWEIRDEG